MSTKTIGVGGCNNLKYFIVPDILTGGYILRSFAKKIWSYLLIYPLNPQSEVLKFLGKFAVIMVSFEAL